MRCAGDGVWRSKDQWQGHLDAFLQNLANMCMTFLEICYELWSTAMYCPLPLSYWVAKVLLVCGVAYEGSWKEEKARAGRQMSPDVARCRQMSPDVGLPSWHEAGDQCAALCHPTFEPLEARGHENPQGLRMVGLIWVDRLPNVANKSVIVCLASTDM